MQLLNSEKEVKGSISERIPGLLSTTSKAQIFLDYRVMYAIGVTTAL